MDRVLLLMEDKENQHQLHDWLAGHYEVALGDAEQLLEQEFDLGVLDGPALLRLEDRVLGRKRAEHPVFLPFLLVTTRHEAQRVARHLRQSVDEVILTPIEKLEVEARLEALLRARRFSIELDQRYRRLFEGVPQGLYRISPDGRILEVNEPLVRMLGCSDRESMRGLRLAETYLDAEQREQWEALLARGGLRYEAELPVRRQDGTTLWAIHSAQAVCDPRGRILHYEGSLVDITARRQAEVERKRMERELLELPRMEALAQVAAGVAHEVRNPLASILAITDALCLDLGDNPEYGPGLERIRGQVGRLSRLMDDLLHLGRPLERARFQRESLPEVCAQALHVWEQSPYHETHSVRLSQPTDAGSLEVIADGLKLQQVLVNLLENAAQHSPAGSAIALNLSGPSDGAIRIRVVDQGAGIPPESFPRLFEPFFTTRHRGTGLGLSIVKRYVEALGGRVVIRNNEPPPGCTVEMRLPAADGDQP